MLLKIQSLEAPTEMSLLMFLLWDYLPVVFGTYDNFHGVVSQANLTYHAKDKTSY